MLSGAFNVLFDVTRMMINNKAYHNDDCIQKKRNRVDQRYEHALGIKVLEIRKGPVKHNYTLLMLIIHTHMITNMKNKITLNNGLTSSSWLPTHLDIQHYTPGQLWREVMSVMSEN